ncbi:MAG TPA: DoxX family protein [Candidatus Limnocylindria bacterium]|nr:DoxX family protein [Candidatus Limnocylindria bacterium]
MRQWVVRVVQGLLAIAFIAFGISHAFALEETRKQVPWTNDVSAQLLFLIGLAELAGAAGLVLSAAKALRWAAPSAAIGLVALMTLALVFHVGRGELTNAVFNMVLGGLAALVAYARRSALPWPRAVAAPAR